MAEANGTSTSPAAQVPPAAQVQDDTKQTNDVPEENEKSELSNAEKKKLAKAEKAAKRAAEKEMVGASAHPKTIPGTQATTELPQTQQGAKRKPSTQKGDGKPQDNRAVQKQGVSGPVKTEKQLPIRGHQGSPSAGSDLTQDTKQVSFFAHLYGQPRRQTLEGSSKDVHPAIQALGLQLSNYTICGSHARCVAMLFALKSVIQSYTTPHGTSLARHLSSHHLSPQLAHLKSHRPFSTSQANSIRWLKNLIANIDPSVPETSAKQLLCDSIDTFVHERFVVADHVIADASADRIEDGDVVLTFAKSAVVTRAFQTAARGSEGKKPKRFQVMVVDSRPLFEGRHLARTLKDEENINVSYCYISALSHAVKGATKCILGAHAILGNGRLYSRVGSALVAMSANERRIPVYVCAETVKFTERVALDSIVTNELAPPEELIPSAATENVSTSNPIASAGTDKPKETPDAVLSLEPQEALSKWRETPNLFVLNPMYDVTPADYIDSIITELGSLPPSAAPAVQRISVGAYAGEVV